MKCTDNLFTTTRQGHIFNLRYQKSIRYMSSTVLCVPSQTDLCDACSLHAYDCLGPPGTHDRIVECNNRASGNKGDRDGVRRGGD